MKESTMTTDTTTPISTVASDPAASTEHLLAVVEPIADGDAPLDFARDVVARGGRASVLMLITDRVRADIRDYAEVIDLPDYAEAEARAIERLTAICGERIGVEVPTAVARFGWLGVDFRRYISEEITSVAVPEAIVGRRGVDRMLGRLGRPVVVTPQLAA
jgi:hypothetical protein